MLLPKNKITMLDFKDLLVMMAIDDAHEEYEREREREERSLYSSDDDNNDDEDREDEDW